MSNHNKNKKWPNTETKEDGYTPDNAGDLSIGVNNGELNIGLGGGLTMDTDGDLGVQIAPGLSVDFDTNGDGN